ncbi:MAG: hypothetical protein WC969_05300 [Elusimicrobiota bacterium]|jgi:hypothetical protein
MKKFLGIALALALVTPSGSASAEVLKNLKVGGALDFQANSAKNVRDFVSQDNDRIGNALTRVMVNTNWDLLDDIHANVSLVKNDRAWGNVGNTGQVGAQSNGSAGAQPIGTAGANVLGSVYLQQANVKVDKFIGAFDAVVGRQFFGEPGDLVIYVGPKNNYGMYVTALDAFRLDWANDMVGFTGLAGKATGNDPATNNQADVDVRGFDVGVKGLPVKLNAFVWNKVSHDTLAAGAQKADYLWVYGLKSKIEAMGGWAGLQFAMNSGENRTIGGGASGNYTGKAAILDLGYKADISNVGAFTPWVNIGAGTGRISTKENKIGGFKSIASDYRPGIINGRFNNVSDYNMQVQAGGDVSTNGLENRIVMGVGLKTTPAMADKLVVGLSFTDYRFQTATDGDATFIMADGRTHNNKHIGSEVGITADWKHSENVSYGVGLAKFLPGGYIYENNRKAGKGVNAATLCFADLSLKF